ncbi:MAG: hypothetical protein KJP23_20805 [Deltaproteobacteria bacterium]|nr:hypothetical protein [Deltaproteobacteria bacterium]
MSSRKKRRKKRKSLNRGVSAVQPTLKAVRNDTNRLSPAKSPAAPAKSADEIKRLISKGKSKAAVSKAKLYHKSLGTVKSEMILVDAYVARIREMIAKGYIVEAKTLLELVEKRYNCPDNLLAELNGMIAVSDGKVDDLVRTLDDPAISQEKRTAIEKIIKTELVDLNLLARSQVISSAHPLKTGALAVTEAFAKVTSGFVQDGEIALPAISRRSPLAPWKMLIKALAFFYRHDDEACEKYLQAVDPESAPGRMVPLLRAMIAGKSNGNHAEKSSLLVGKITGNRQQIQHALRMLDNALAGGNPRKLFKAARNAANICRKTCPELMDRLQQHISIRSWMLGMDADDVQRALGGPSLKNAYFWRLHARAAEIKGNHLLAGALLEEFRKHALHEGWFAEKSNEIAVIYLYMAELVQRYPAEDIEWLQSNFKREFRGFESDYDGQPESVLEALRKDNPNAVYMYFLYPARLYRLASEIDPAADTFRQWLEWTENHASHWKPSDAVAGAWHAAIPDDTRPLLYLMKSAEKRNALNKALGYLDKAERIDGLDPDVKRARLRLLTATAVRHLKQKKTHLAQKDLTAIEALPQSGEGDRPAFLVALKSVCAVIDGQKSQLSRLNDELINLLESPVTAKVVMQGLLQACSLSDRQINLPAPTKAPLRNEDLAIALARGCRLGDDMGIPITIPLEYEKKLRNFFSTEDGSHDTATIRVIAETALRNKHYELAYAAAGVGLVKQGAATARFLLLRARSLPTWEIERKDDCLTAAIELARRERDLDLIDEAIELRRNGNRMPFGFSLFNNMIGEDKPSMDAEELNDVLELEKEAREYPFDYMSDDFDDDDDDNDDDDDESECRYCDAKNCPDRDAPFRPNELYAEEFDDDDIDEFPDFNTLLDDFLPDLPPDLMSLIMKVFAKHGRNGSFPDLEELSRKDPWLADRLLREMQKAETDGTLPDLGQDWFPGRRSRKTKRKRR